MSQHRFATARAAGSPPARRHRWLIGAVAVLGVGGLAFGSLGIPVSADELNAAGNVHTSADVEGDCVTAAIGTGELSQSFGVQQDQETAPVRANGEGTLTASICRDDLGGSPPDDPEDPDVPGSGLPGDGLPEDLGDIVPGDLGDIVPGDGGGTPPGNPGGEIPGSIDDVLPGDIGDLIPGDNPGGGGPGGGGPGGGGPGGGGPGGGGPGGGGPGGGGPGGGGDGSGPVRDLAGDGLGLVPALADRLGQLVPAPGGGAPGGNTGGNTGGTPGGNTNGNAGGNTNGNPATGGSPSGTPAGSVAVRGTGDTAEGGAPSESLLGAELERGVAPSAGIPVATDATLPRTGGGLGSGVLRLVAFLGLARALLGLANRRRPGAGPVQA